MEPETVEPETDDRPLESELGIELGLIKFELGLVIVLLFGILMKLWQL